VPREAGDVEAGHHIEAAPDDLAGLIAV